MTGAPYSSVKRYRELVRKPTRTGLDRELLLDGPHLVSEARASQIAIESAVFEHDALNTPEIRTLAEALAADGVDVFIVSRKSLEAMSPVKTPTGVVAIVRRSLVSLEDVMKGRGPSAQLLVVAHDIQDPGNMGGIIRTAEASGATAIVATPGTADPFGWKAMRGSMGSALRMPIAHADLSEVLRQCRRNDIKIAALAPRGGQPFFAAELRAPTALLLGGEGPGLSDQILREADERLSVPMDGRVESLNVGVAAALVLYEAFRQRTANESVRRS